MSRRMGFLPRKLEYSSSSSAALLLLSNKKTAFSVANEGGEIGGDEKKDEEEEEEKEEDERWSRMLPEILIEIVRRLDEGEGARWPVRRSVVAFGGTCRRWREVALDVVKPPALSGKITFPISLKQPGPRDKCFQCFIRRDKRNATYYLYLCLSNAWVDNGKLLMAARRSRRGAHIEYVISLDADDLSQGSNAYLGKLRSDFLGINFTIFDSQPPFDGAKAVYNRSSRRFTSKQISPQVPAGNFEVGHVSYKFNLLRSRGPRRMVCKLPCPTAKQTAPAESLGETKLGGTVVGGCAGNVVLKNKAPRWHEHLQCWCLNFHGRVTVASVKNFQLVVATDPRRPGNDETILQFGKVDEDTFTMDYRDPLSAFQAFAICLTSFGTKPACE